MPVMAKQQLMFLSQLQPQQAHRFFRFMFPRLMLMVKIEISVLLLQKDYSSSFPVSNQLLQSLIRKVTVSNLQKLVQKAIQMKLFIQNHRKVTASLNHHQKNQKESLYSAQLALLQTIKYELMSLLLVFKSLHFIMIIQRVCLPSRKAISLQPYSYFQLPYLKWSFLKKYFTLEV